MGLRSLFTHFVVGNAIGLGQFGKVYLAHSKQVQRSVMTAPYHKVLPGKKVAVKVIHKKNDSKLLLETQINEIEILRVCNHQNVKIYIVMEYIDGVDLIHYIKKKKRLTDNEMQDISVQIVEGVKHLHELGIVHRDLKLENIMVVSDQDNKGEERIRVKLIDFGLAKILTSLEKTTQWCGTLSFCSPEIVREQPYNQKSDIWALGVILHLLLTKCYPFMDKNFEMTKRQILEKVLTINSQKIKKLPVQVQSTILKILEKNQDERPSIQEVIEFPWIKHLRKKYLKIM
ncbi:hypothetical protein FGO68_gene12550 [Halteria grandinella]|uniref:Protein kinase domain-containing protein n=1 Tax=Halteria grandinella TaxID=5974 RepID=A0A8J8P439_HALGN|nr:hypothetical protein FGO68_gene12550 [Halteria grandinella]